MIPWTDCSLPSWTWLALSIPNHGGRALLTGHSMDWSNIHPVGRTWSIGCSCCLVHCLFSLNSVLLQMSPSHLVECLSSLCEEVVEVGRVCRAAPPFFQVIEDLVVDNQALAARATGHGVALIEHFGVLFELLVDQVVVRGGPVADWSWSSGSTFSPNGAPSLATDVILLRNFRTWLDDVDERLEQGLSLAQVRFPAAALCFQNVTSHQNFWLRTYIALNFSWP